MGTGREHDRERQRGVDEFVAERARLCGLHGGRAVYRCRGRRHIADRLRKQQVGNWPRGLEQAPRGHPAGPYLEAARVAQRVGHIDVAAPVGE